MKSHDEIKKGLEYLHIKDIAQKLEAWEEGVAYEYVEDIAADALALIQQLEAQVPSWISVEERLPEPNTVVIVGGNGKVTSGIYHGTYGLWTTHGEIDFDYWMPLPQPPEMKEE